MIPPRNYKTVSNTADLSEAPDQVWAVIGQFGGIWHPLVARIELNWPVKGSESESVHHRDDRWSTGSLSVLEAIDDAQRFFYRRYTMISGIPR